MTARMLGGARDRVHITTWARYVSVTVLAVTRLLIRLWSGDR